MKIELPGFEKRGSSKELVVIIHAYTSSPKHLSAVRELVANQLPNADLYVPTLPAAWSSLANPVMIVQDLLEKLDAICGSTDEEAPKVAYEKIILVGHSLGALLARKLYIAACGEIAGVPMEAEISAKETRPWAPQVERIILLAGMNRGWRISHHLSFCNALIWSFGTLWGNLVWLLQKKQQKRPPLIFAIRKGAPFITQLRIHWVHMRNRAAERKIGKALTIQLLGSVDDMVSPEDNIDLVSGRDFIYLDVPYSGHVNVIEMDDPSPLPHVDIHSSATNNTIGDARSAVFLQALLQSKEELQDDSMLPTNIPLETQNHRVTDVVFIIHGIRDLGYWTHKVARRIHLLAKRGNNRSVVLATETSSYGYFPILPFLLPTKRREKVEWMMDQYAQALALYPNAKCSFVGHSHGTYLLTRALHDYPVCRFKNVVLAGSVVRTAYDWKSVIAAKQVEKVLNYVATADWVVAFFPRTIQMLGIQDLGSAGHDGFKAETADPKVEQIKYVKGYHSAALNEANWDAIAQFALTGQRQEPPTNITGKQHSWLVKHPSLAALAIFLLIITIVLLIVSAIVCSSLPEWGKTISLMLGFLLLWKIVTVV